MTAREDIIKNASIEFLIRLAYEVESPLSEAAYNEIERRSGR